MREKEREGGRKGHLAAAAAVRPSQCVRGWLPTRWLVGILSPACNHSNSARGEENQSLPAAAVRDFPSFLPSFLCSLPSFPFTLPPFPFPYLTSTRLSSLVLYSSSITSHHGSPLFSSPFHLLLLLSFHYCSSSLIFSLLFYLVLILPPLPSTSLPTSSPHVIFTSLSSFLVLCQSPSLITCCSSNVNSWYGQFPAKEGEMRSAFLHLHRTDPNGIPHLNCVMWWLGI